MTLTNRLGTRFRTLVIGLMAMGLALGVSSQFGTTTAHAASDGPVWIAEVSRPYGNVTTSPATGADCGGGYPYPGANYERRVFVHPPVAQAGSAPATIQWWVRLYDGNTGAIFIDWVYRGAYAFPAYSAPMTLGASGMTYTGLRTAISLRAQIYYRVSDPKTGLETTHGWLLVTQYLSLQVNNYATNVWAC